MGLQKSQLCVRIITMSNETEKTETQPGNIIDAYMALTNNVEALEARHGAEATLPLREAIVAGHAALSGLFDVKLSEDPQAGDQLLAFFNNASALAGIGADPEVPKEKVDPTEIANVLMGEYPNVFGMPTQEGAVQEIPGHSIAEQSVDQTPKR